MLKNLFEKNSNFQIKQHTFPESTLNIQNCTFYLKTIGLVTLQRAKLGLDEKSAQKRYNFR